MLHLYRSKFLLCSISTALRFCFVPSLLLYSSALFHLYRSTFLLCSISTALFFCFVPSPPSCSNLLLYSIFIALLFCSVLSAYLHRPIFCFVPSLLLYSSALFYLPISTALSSALSPQTCFTVHPLFCLLVTILYKVIVKRSVLFSQSFLEIMYLAGTLKLNVETHIALLKVLFFSNTEYFSTHFGYVNIDGIVYRSYVIFEYFIICTKRATA